MASTPQTPTPPTAPPGAAARRAESAERGIAHSPSPRVTTALAAVVLAIGVAVGAAIGPAPSASFAGASRLPLLLPSLIARAAAGHSPTPASTAKAQPPPPVAVAATPTPARGAGARRHAASTRAPTSASSTPAPSTETTPPASSAPAPATKTSPLPPITKVWLVELAGGSFGEALAQASAAPYIDTQAVGAGTLLSGWSALDGGAFANEAALLASSPPQVLDTIVQPPCPEGAAGAQCATGTLGALTAADEFLKATVPTITSTSAYRENGLIVVTFATVANATATGLPSGAATATLTSQPPAGVLLISPFASAGARSSAVFDPTSPRQSLEKLLHH